MLIQFDVRVAFSHIEPKSSIMAMQKPLVPLGASWILKNWNCSRQLCNLLCPDVQVMTSTNSRFLES